jgi:phage tail sheath protein FI
LDEDNSPKEQATALQLAGGDDGSAVTSTQVNTGWDLFADKNAVTVNILLAGGWTAASTVSKIVDDVAAVRGDCTAKIDTPYYVSQSSDAIAWAATLSVSNPSYYTAYYPWLKVTDEYNDKTVIVPPSGYTAGVRARTNKVANVWSAAYGLNRGVINAVAPVVYIDETNQDLLYDAQINPIIRVPGVGVVVWGQRTGQAKESALSGENVRCLLNYWETAIEATLQYYLGEENTEFTRTQVKQACDNFTDPLVAKGAFYDAQIVCDETNNTSTTIDAGELHVDGYVQPVKIADRIPFKIVITRTGVNLQELASSAVV